MEHLTKLRVLVVEDEILIATDIAESVRNLGYEVTDVCASGEEAIISAEAKRPDIALLDIRLKGDLDGIGVAAYVREKLGSAVVFLTAYSDEKTLQRAKFTEPFGYLLKPFLEAELKATLAMVAHRYQKERERQAKGAQASAVRQPRASDGGHIPPMNPQDENSCFHFLRSLAVLDQITDEELRDLAKSAHYTLYKAGDIIINEGQNAKGFLISEGRVAYEKMSMNGKSLTVELIAPGDIYSLLSAVEDSPSPVSIRAQVDSKLVFLPSKAVAETMERHPALYRTFTNLVSQRLETSHNLARQIAHERVEVRIASVLTSLAKNHAEIEPPRGTPKIEVTRQEIADLTGTTPETAIRITKEMEREGLLDLSSPGIIRIVDLSRIQQCAQEL